MVDNHIKRSLNLLHINKCNQVDILVGARRFSSSTTQLGAGDDIPKEEYMETGAGIPRRTDDLFTDCVVYVSDDPPDDLLMDHPALSMDDDRAVLIAKSSADDVVAGAQEIVQSQHIVGEVCFNHTDDGMSPLLDDDQPQQPSPSLSLDQLKSICRCCLSDERDLQSLYENENCIADMIMAIATIQLSPNDNLPGQICMQCVLQLSSALSFKQQLETADDSLRRFVEQGYLDGAKLVSLDCAEISEPIATGSPPIQLETKPDESISQLLPNSSISIKPIPSPSSVILLERMLSNPESVSDYREEQLLQPMAVPSSSQHGHESDAPYGQDFLDDDALVTDLTYDDDANTLLQPLEMHQLPRDDDEEDDDDAEYEKDEYEEDDDDDDDDEEEEEVDEEPGSSLEIAEATGGDVDEANEKVFSSDKINLKQHMQDQEHKPMGKTENSGTSTDLSSATIAEMETDPSSNLHCKICALDFSEERDLFIHRSLHREDGKIECVECNKQCSSIVQLKRHIRIHFKDKPHKCAVCDKGFPERGSLTRHFRKHTDNVRERKHVCTVCDKKYYDSHSLSIHRRTHTGERPYVCLVCGKGFIDLRLLNSHAKVHSSDKPHACTICDRRFTHQSTLTTHVRTHTGEKPYVCAMCGKSFIQSSNLMLHMRVHSGEKPYKCNLCDRSFVSSSTLNTHSRTHTGEKPYTCEICNKRFARHDLTAHMRMHNGVKPFSCTSCQRAFTTSAQLKQHRRKHTGEHPFECKVCNKSCSSAAYLEKHLLAHINAPIDNPSSATPGNQISPSSAQAKSSKFSTAVSSHPSTFFVINELSSATDDTANKPTNTREENDESSGKHIYQAIDPTIFRIQQVRSVGRPKVKKDKHLDASSKPKVNK